MAVSTSTTLDLVLRSTFIFSGTVVRLNQSSVKVLKPRPGFAVVRFDRAIRVNPVLGNLDGRPITVQLVKGAAVQPGQELIFFANSWVHGEEIAVAEVAHLEADSKTEREVAKTVDSLPQNHLASRVASATLIVTGTVTRVAPAGIPEPITEHAAQWMRATIQVQQVLKGSDATRAKERLQILFPASLDPLWRNYPKLAARQRAIFLLHSTTLKRLPPATLMLVDPADVQPTSEAGTIREM